MFLSTYKTTIRNIIRSKTFWLAFCVVLIYCVYDIAFVSHYAVYSFEENEMIWDTDPRFVLEYKTFVKQAINSAEMLLRLSMSIFFVITTVLALNRDYGDRFFEIEKAAGVKPSCYLFGRLSALISVNFGLLLLVHTVTFQWYVLSRGGVAGMAFWDYAWEGLVRTARIDLLMGLPCVVFFVGLTYMIGSLFKNGLPAAIMGMAYGIFCMLVGKLYTAGAFVTFFQDYLRPEPMKMFWYLYYYDTEWFEDALNTMQTSAGRAFFSVGILVGLAAVCSVISYLRLRRREV